MPHYEFDGLKQNIATLEQKAQEIQNELADMKRQLKEQKKCKWDMKPAQWHIDGHGNVTRTANGILNSYADKFGMKRHTKELAEISAKRMKQSNLLEYWSTVIDPDWRDDGGGSTAWHIYLNDGKYYINWHVGSRALGQVYMSEKAATEICAALNSGELVL